MINGPSIVIELLKRKNMCLNLREVKKLKLLSQFYHGIEKKKTLKTKNFPNVYERKNICLNLREIGQKFDKKNKGFANVTIV